MQIIIETTTACLYINGEMNEKKKKIRLIKPVVFQKKVKSIDKYHY